MATSLGWISRRKDLNGGSVAGALQSDVTLTTTNLGRGFDLQFGVRNLLGRDNYDPVALNRFVDLMPRPARTFFVRVLWRTDD